MEFLRNFFTPPTYPTDAEQTRVARILNTLLMIGLALPFFVGIVLYIIAVPERKLLYSLAQFIQVPFWVLLVYLNRSGRTRIAAFIYVFINFLIVSFFQVITAADIVHSGSVLAYALVLALAGLLLSPTLVYGYFGLILFVLAGVQTAVQRGLILPAPASSNAVETIIGYAVIFLVLTVILSIASNSYQQTAKDLYVNDRSLLEKNQELENVRQNLEMRVQERSQAIERRNRQLQAAAEAGKAITSIRNLDQLLDQTCAIISDRFGFYHVGVFLLDPAGEYAVLQAANSIGGRKMLERKHKLRVGETGIVGNVTQSGQARIALDVGHDAVFFNNPDLPDTHSEMALPITISNTILGALDVQSTQTGAFTNDDIATLQILADQLAVGIQNARLFDENRLALESSRRAYGELSRSDWQKLLKTQGQIGFVGGTLGTVQPAPSTWEKESAQAVQSGNIVVSNETQALGIPLKVRGQAIGAIRMRKQDQSQPWSPDEKSLALAFAEQLTNALESARLYQDAQTRASHEAIVSEISARINATPNIETILKETVQELGLALGNTTVSFQLIEPGNAPGRASENE